MSDSLLDSLRSKSRSREHLARALLGLDHDTLEELLLDWRGVWARPDQLQPLGDWLIWLILAGRGYGKTRTGAETVRDWAESEKCRRIALVARTAADVRDVMVNGESGILAVSHPGCMPIYEPSKRQLTWPNGVIAKTYSADAPDLLRGPQHDGAWCDELAAWRYLEETWSNLMLGLRLGKHPRCVVTTTPRPRHLLRQLVKASTTHVTRGSTYANLANLSPMFKQQVLSKYEGTTLGRQELLAELLDESPGALWKRARIDELRVAAAPVMARIVVGVDPAVTSNDDSDETGIVVKGICTGPDGRSHLYTLADYSGRYSPQQWGAKAVQALRDWRADRIIAEANNGGDMVGATIQQVDPNAPVMLVHASRGKHTRAEPIAALHEQGREHHVGIFPELEDQKCSWVPGDDKSPDRMDADVWASTELIEGMPTIVGVGEGDSGRSAWAQ